MASITETPVSPLPPRWQRILLTLSTIGIFATILWCNMPASVHQTYYNWCEKSFSPQTAYKLRKTEWCARYAAHIGGVDNRWQMYGGQSRFNWEFLIYGEYGEGDNKVERLLPLPRQSQRSLLTRWIVDYKEAKFYLNIYNDELGRECYARYLGRQYPEYQGLQLKSVRFDQRIRYILPPYVAVEKQCLFEDGYSQFMRDRFEVTNEVRRALANRSPPASSLVQEPANTLNQVVDLRAD